MRIAQIPDDDFKEWLRAHEAGLQKLRGEAEKPRMIIAETGHRIFRKP